VDVAAAVTVVMVVRHQPPPAVALPLRETGQLTLPGDSSRFDYASLDPGRGPLFVAHLGASQIIEIDIHANQVVRVIDGIDQAHGVLVVPQRHRVYATATGANRMVTLDEDTGQQLAQAPTGDYPDGLAYDPDQHTIWTTNESGGSETVIDADTNQVHGTVQLGGEAGNVYYDPTSRLMLADVQTRNELAVVDPTTLAVTRRVPLPGCDHDHGLALDPAHRLAFVACDANATLLSVDMTTWQILDAQRVGNDPDVLAYDPSAGRLYVAAESGWLTILDQHDRRLTVTGRAYLADGAHIVAEHQRDAGPADLQFGQAVGDRGRADPVEGEDPRVAVLHDHGGAGQGGQSSPTRDVMPVFLLCGHTARRESRMAAADPCGIGLVGGVTGRKLCLTECSRARVGAPCARMARKRWPMSSLCWTGRG
jgi:DNA-binding beta-propeller fold protein YncE